MSTIEKWEFYLDSKYRTGGRNPDPTWNLKQPIVLSDPMHYFVARIASCEIPYSFKAINASNNTLQVNYNYHSGVHNVTGNITLANGNYTILTILEELKDKLLIFIKAIEPNHYPDFNFTYDRDSGKATLGILKRSGQEASLTLYWTLNDLLAEFFGFDGSFDSVLSYDSGGTITSTNFISNIHVNCSPITAVYIRSDNLIQRTNNEEYLVEFQESTSDILFKCLVNTPFNSWIIQQNPDLEVRIVNNLIDRISLYLTTLTYDLINLDGVHWRTHLIIEERRPEILDKIDQLAQENEMKIKELEDQRNALISQLTNIKDGLKQDIIQSIKPDANAPKTEPENIEKMKEDFIKEVQQNRQNNIN